MGRMLLTIKQTGSDIRCHERGRVNCMLRSLKLGRIGRTSQVADTPAVRRMLERVKHIVDVIYRQIDIRYFAEQVRVEYRDAIIGPDSRVVRDKQLWDQFEAASEACLAHPDMDDRRLTEVVNEIAVAAVLLEEKALKGCKIAYEPNQGIIDSALKAANEAAKDCAPYLHPRLSAVEHKSDQFDALAKVLKLIDGTTKGLPDQSKIPTDPDMIDVTPTPLTPELQALPGAPVPRLPN